MKCYHWFYYIKLTSLALLKFNLLVLCYWSKYFIISINIGYLKYYNIFILSVQFILDKMLATRWIRTNKCTCKSTTLWHKLQWYICQTRFFTSIKNSSCAWCRMLRYNRINWKRCKQFQSNNKFMYYFIYLYNKCTLDCINYCLNLIIK